MNLALRDIRHNLLRFVLTVVGAGLLLTSAMGMGGLYRGIVRDALRVLDLIDTDLWVVEAGTQGPFAEASTVPDYVQDRARGVPGVAAVRRYFEATVPVGNGSVMNSLGESAMVVGIDYPTDAGRWLPLVQGRYFAQGHGEVIADETLGLHLGQEVTLGRDVFTVVGLMRGLTSGLGDGALALTLADARAVQAVQPPARVYQERAGREGASRARMPTVPALMLDLQPGADAEQVARTIERWGDVTVVPHAAQRALLLEGRLGRLRAQVLAFTVLLLVITGVVVTLIIYTLTLESCTASPCSSSSGRATASSSV